MCISPIRGTSGCGRLTRAHGITHALLMIWAAQFQRGELTDEIDYVKGNREVEAKTAALERGASGAQRQMRGLARLGDQHDLG